MKMQRWFLLVLFIQYVYSGDISAARPKSVDVKGEPCLRLFHSKGDVGCRSRFSKGSSAKLYSIENEQDFIAIDTVKEDKIIIMPSSMFREKELQMLKSKINGLFIYPNDGERFSPASKTPQGKNSVDGLLNPYRDAEWNPFGLDLLESTFSYPVVVVNSKQHGMELVEMALRNDEDEGKKYGGDVKANMKYYFGQDGRNSMDCLQFKNIFGAVSPKCDPIGGQSVWGSLGPEVGNEEIVMAMTSMDSNAFAKYMAYGANDAFSNVIALLATADALGRLPQNIWEKTIVFAAFQAEAFGFVGSRRFLFDMERFKNGACTRPITNTSTPYGDSFCTSPIVSSDAFQKVKNIKYAIAVDQIGKLNEDNQFYFHLNPNSEDVDAFIEKIISIPAAEGKLQIGSANAIPPTPLTSFINGNELGRDTLTSAVLTGYDTAFTDNQYHSQFDKNTSISAESISDAATILAQSLHNLAAKDNSSITDISVNTTLIETLITCFSNDWQCDFMQSYSQYFLRSTANYFNSKQNLQDFPKPPHYYSSVYGGYRQPRVEMRGRIYTDFNKTWEEKSRLILVPNPYETFIHSFLSASFAQIPSNDRKSCQNDTMCESTQSCVYPGKCQNRTTYFHNAYSIGLESSKYRRIFTIINDTLPLWTEPQWEKIGSYVFTDSNGYIGILSLILGILFTVSSIFASKSFLKIFQKQKLL